MLAQGTVVAGRFQLKRVLGNGGMGTVWLAHHIGLDTPCALKFIHPEVAMNPNTRARFEREAKVVAQLRSPHVVQVLDHGEWEGLPYIAMEYLEGEDLGSRLKRLGRLNAYQTVVLVSQVARALSRAHGAGLVHRDLKPENIFLVRDEDQEIVKVLDFGIAKSTTSQLHGSTATGALLGTPNFMSPEQAQGTKTVDFRSDLWSLAVVAFQCLTGRLPFVSDALGDLLVQIIVGPLPVPSQLAPDLPSRFDGWWQRAAARDPDERFQSAKELADSLALALNVSTSLGVHGPSHPDISGVVAPPSMSAVVFQGHPSQAQAAGQLQRGSGFAQTPPIPSLASPSITGPAAIAATPAPTLDNPLAPTTSDPLPAFATVPGVSRTFEGERARTRTRTGLRIAVGAGMVLLGSLTAVLVFGLGDRKTQDAGRATASAPVEPASPAPAAESAAASAPVASAESAAAASSKAAASAASKQGTKGAPPSATDPVGAPHAPGAPRSPDSPPAAPISTARPTGAPTYNPGF